MDRKSPPERSSPDPPDMATMVLPQSTGVNKRYRPTPAKTFQCRGFGDCRMVFSRSEHLARHVRKHTGERPFGCHCGKQFSRLDNLRQHAQTVHADKQEQNEAMMRHLTSLHASMAAANKVGHSRGGRRPNHNTGNAIKQEDFSIKERRGISLNQISIDQTRGRATTIPFVTPASPFLSPQQQQPIPFSPSPPHSASVSPTQHGEISGQDLAPVGLQLQGTLQTRLLEHSHPSLQSSPLPSPHPHSNSSRSSPHRSSNSPRNTYFPFPTHMSSEDLQPQHDQAQLQPQPHSSHHHQNLLYLADVDWPVVQSYHYPMDATPQTWDQQPTISNQHHPLPDTIPHFSSSHPPSANHSQRSSPPPPPPPHHHHPPSTQGSEHTEDPTGHGMIPPTEQNRDLNLADSQSWSSAMTIPQLGQFYYPSQPALGRTRHPAHSSRLLRPSPLSILSPPPPPPPPPATHLYSQELLRQQEAQFRQAEHMHVRTRRHSEEMPYLHHHHQQPFVSTFPAQRQFYITGQDQETSPPDFIQRLHPLDPGHPIPQVSPREMQFLLQQTQRQHYLAEAMESLHTPPLLLE